MIGGQAAGRIAAAFAVLALGSAALAKDAATGNDAATGKDAAAAKAKPAGATSGKKADPEEPSPALRRRIAALALKQVQFGSVSLIPVRFENSRLAGPFEDGGRRLYCVSSHMKGRTLGKAERPKAVIREDGPTLTVIDDDEACTGQRTKPFAELDSAKEE